MTSVLLLLSFANSDWIWAFTNGSTRFGVCGGTNLNKKISSRRFHFIEQFHLPYTKLSTNLGGNDRLGPNARKCALDAVKRKWGMSHATHENIYFVWGHCDGCADSFLDICNRVVKRLVDFSNGQELNKTKNIAWQGCDTPFFFSWWIYHFLYTRNQYLAAGVYKFAHDSYQVGHGFMHGPPKSAGMQISGWARNDDFVVGYPS